jgi:DNA-binding MarR family transcriptional regulator
MSSNFASDESLGSAVATEAVDSPGSGTPVGCHERQAELDFRLLVLVDQLRARIAGVSAELGLTPQQAMLLRHLGQPRTMGDIACVLGCDRSNVTGLVDRMAARGWVQRVADPSDRRIKHLVLTPEGQTLRAALQDRLFAESPTISVLDLAERQQLLHLLRKLTPAIDEES